MAIASSPTNWGVGDLVKSEGVSTIDSSDKDDVIEFPEGRDPERENLKKSAFVAFVEGRYSRAKIARFTEEQRWLMSYRNHRGLYGPEVQFLETEKSRAFVKITKTKVLAAYAQIIDVLFSTGKFPIGVEPSEIPEGIAESVHIDPAKQQQQPAAPQAAPQTTATVARPDILKMLGPVEDKLAKVGDKLEEGPGTSATAMTWEPAKIAANKLEKKMHDQLAEAQADRSLRAFAIELCLFGTGVFKGPMLKEKEYAKWSKEGEYEPVTKKIADFTNVSIWDSYPDPEARHADEMEDFIQRHRMSKTQLRALKRRPFFRPKSIELAIEGGFNYHKEYWENELEDYKNEATSERFEVLEFWGIVDKDVAEQAELDIPAKYKNRDQIQVNAWICNGQVLRLVFNQFTPARIPYMICPYEVNPYSIFGIGVADNMADTQLAMNGFWRMMIDNAVLSNNVIFEVDETNLVPGQNLKMYPGKVIRRQGGQPQTALTVNKFPNTTQENLIMFDKARQLADESTGIPSYSHGQGGVQGIGRTASGMSMLMGAAAQNIKAVVRNIDDYLLIPLAKALFAFNMQFDFDEDFVGDLEVVARGTESLMRNEVRSQKLLQFMQLTNNPTDAPWVKRDYILRELAESLDLESDKVVNDPREAGLQALMLQELQLAQGLQPGMGAETGGNPSAAPSVNDPTQTGGGNVSPGAAPTPGEAGNTGAGGGTNKEPPA